MRSTAVSSPRFWPISLKAMYRHVFSSTAGSLTTYQQEILCIIESGPTPSSHTHPFRLVRNALAGNGNFGLTHSPWTNRCAHVYPASNKLTRIMQTPCCLPSFDPCNRGQCRLPSLLLLLANLDNPEIEILPSGETGPLHLDDDAIMLLHGVPFLTISEFIRAKLKTWMMYVASLFLPSPRADSVFQQ